MGVSFLVIVQTQEFHEVLILSTQPTGFLQRTSMADQISRTVLDLRFTPRLWTSSVKA